MTDLVERFWPKVDVGDASECWMWKAGRVRGERGSSPYGSFRGDQGKMMRAHRVVYELCIGPIPRGLVIRHRCDVPLCCNPHHLQLGTHADNVADRDRRGRGRFLRGEQHGVSRLTESLVRTIRQNLRFGRGQRELAREYGVAQCTIYNIAHGKTWGHVND